MHSSFCSVLFQPILTKRITKTKIEWRIRNLPYPRDVYKVTIDAAKQAIVVRTENKKYYKSINVPELDRCELPLDEKNLSIDYKFNTLIILVWNQLWSSFDRIRNHPPFQQYLKHLFLGASIAVRETGAGDANGSGGIAPATKCWNRSGRRGRSGGNAKSYEIELSKNSPSARTKSPPWLLFWSIGSEDRLCGVIFHDFVFHNLEIYYWFLQIENN